MSKYVLSLKFQTGDKKEIALASPHETVLLNIPIKCETKDPLILKIYSQDGNYWIMSSNSHWLEVSGVKLRESTLVPHIIYTMEDVEIQLIEKTQALELPIFPPRAKPWFTQCQEGKDILNLSKNAANTNLAINLCGETGVGKEVIAQLIHHWSPRKSGPFIAINCGALPLQLAESELFGHTKGSFTGAHQSRAGSILQAHQGTLFLDEIADLSLEIQVKLLRFLESGELRAVGSDHTSRVNVRIISASHQNLHELVEQGKFRRDLYFRLSSISLHIPPLRERPLDVQLLASQFARSQGFELTKRALNKLLMYPWPGNVRELKHAIERACGMHLKVAKLLCEEDFNFLEPQPSYSQKSEVSLYANDLTLASHEKALLIRVLKLTQGNRKEAAEIMGIGRSTVFQLIKKYKIQSKLRTHLIPMPPPQYSANHLIDN